MIKNIVLDMGNVLLNYDPEIPLIAFCDCEEAKDIIRRELFEGPEWIMGDLGEVTDAGRYDLVKERVPEIYHEALKKCCDEWDICMTPVDGARDFCHKMREMGKKIYVLSNASDKFYTYFLNFLPLDFFDGIVVSADEHIIKPNLQIYKRLLDRYHLLAEECLFIDDRKDNVEGAKAVGMQAIQFMNNYMEISALLEAEE